MYSSKRSLPPLRESQALNSLVRNKENAGEKIGPKNKRVVIEDRNRTRRIKFKKKI